jgi:Coenzyme PQQ synthesis protein D (PqqD)
MSQETIPVRLEGLIINDDDVTPTLINPLNGHIFVTNKVGKRVVEICDGQKGVDDIVRRISQEFSGSSLEAIRIDVNEFLELASRNGVIIWQRNT